MSENQTSAKSTVEGELGLNDLEKIAGGTGEFVPMEIRKVDSSYLSYVGAFGTKGHESPASLPPGYIHISPAQFNTSTMFP